MKDILFLAMIAVIGALPTVTIYFRRKIVTLTAFIAWLGLAALFLLRPAANSLHAFGLAIFMVFLIGWLLALGVIFHPNLSTKYWVKQA